MLNSSTPVAMAGPPHFVDLHVNPGESVSLQLFDGNETILRGPATITMVSQHTFPPIPMPVQVPPGHMVQQIVDENGTLRHIILSALNNNGANNNHQQGTAAVIQQQQAGYPVGCCCCCYCSGAPNPALPTPAPPPLPMMAPMHANLLPFSNPQNGRRRTPSRNTFNYTKRSGVSPAYVPNYSQVSNHTKSPSRGKYGYQSIHVEDVSQIIPTNQDYEQTSQSINSSELISNTNSGDLSDNKENSSALQLNCKVFQPRSPKKNQVNLLDSCPPPSSLSSMSPTSIDSSAGYASDKYVEEHDRHSYGTSESSPLPNGSSHSRTSSSSPISGLLKCGHMESELEDDYSQGFEILPQSEMSDKNDSDLLIISESFGPKTDIKMVPEIRHEKMVSDDVLLNHESQTLESKSTRSQKTSKSGSASPKKNPIREVKLQPERKPTNRKASLQVPHEQQIKKSPQYNQNTHTGAADSDSDKCKSNDLSEEIKSNIQTSTQVSGLISDEKVLDLIENRSVCNNKVDQTEVAIRCERKHPACPAVTARLNSRASSADQPLEQKAADKEDTDKSITHERPQDADKNNAVENITTTTTTTVVVPCIQNLKPSPQRSPKHLLPQVQQLNLTYTTLTANSVRLKWSFQANKSELEKGLPKDCFSRHYLVEMSHTRPDEDGKPIPVVRIVYQGNMNTCRVLHLGSQQQYSFRVRMPLDEEVLVSNLLTITTPELALVKHKKTKQPALQQQAANQQLLQQLLLQQQHQNHQQAHGDCHLKDDDQTDPTEKSDQKCAIMILVLFTLLALIVAFAVQQLLCFEEEIQH